MKKIFIITASLLLASALALADEEQSYTNASVARLSFLSGNTYLQRVADLAYEEGQVNSPVTEGDRLGTTDGRAEVSLGRGNFLRLNIETKVDFLNLPKKNTDLTRLKVWTGNVYLSLQSLIKEKCYEVHTSDASIYVLEKGIFRVDVLENERTEVLVFEGAVEVAGQDGSNILSGGQKIEVAAGRFLSRPTRMLVAATDNFDQWNTDRESLNRKQMAEHYLPEELWEYEYELDQYGDWHYMSPYGHVWIPRGLGPGWRPYYHGRWVWIPFCGWTWVGYDPWGWAPYHYGRWHWDPFYGWYWIPTSIWGPAWVSWWWGWDYYGWAPLGWYGYPGYIYSNRFYDRYYGDYRFNRAMTVIHKNQLKAPDVSKVAVSSDRLRNVDKITMTTDARLAPRPETFRAVSIEKLDNGRVFLRQGGSGGEDKRLIRGRTSSSGGESSGQGTVIRRRDSTENQSQGQAEGQDSGRSTRQITERPSRESNSPRTVQDQGTSQGSSEERKIRKKDDDQDSSASGSFTSNSFSGYPSSSSSRSSQGYSSRSSSIYNRIFRSGSSSRLTAPSSSWRGSVSRSYSGSSSSYRSSSGSRSSSSSSRSSSGHSSSSSGNVRRKN